MEKKESIKRKVAVFDIDGTVFRSSLLVEIVEELIRSGAFPRVARKGYEREYRLWLDRRGSYEKYITAVVNTFHRYLKGVSFSVFREASRNLMRERKDRVYRYTTDLIRDLKRKKYFLLAISHSPKNIVDEFCAHLGFDKVYGRLYTLGPGQRFTGAVDDLHLIENKANIVKRAVEKEGLTLRGSVGVGDTESDLPLLELVETAICFNPNAALYRHARRNSWRVVVERKDVIYDIEQHGVPLL